MTTAERRGRGGPGRHLGRIDRILDRILDRVWLAPEDPTALGLVRIAVVAVLTASLLTHIGAVADDQDVSATDFTAETPVDAHSAVKRELALEMGATSE